MKYKNKLVEVLDELVNADNQNDFSMVTYRTSQKNAMMIELMSVVLQKPISNLFTSLLSEKLVESLLSDEKNMEVLKEYFLTEHHDSGFIKLLEDEGIIHEHLELLKP